MRVYLIGFMGCGKSHTGKILAKKMQLPFFDLDAEIEKVQAATINDIFKNEGEDFFRNLEHNVLKVFTQNHDHFVMSCGGGTPCFYDNMAYMKAHGAVVWLNTPPEILLGRLRLQKSHRPLLQGMDDEQLENFIVTKNNERKKYYEQATVVVNDAAMPSEAIIKLLNDE